MSHNTRHISHRMAMHDASKPVNALERSRKLKSLNVTRSKLLSIVKTSRNIINSAEAERIDAEKRMKEIEMEIAKLKDISDSPIITEHALLRYVERQMGIDLEKVHQEILDLPDELKIKSGNTIITVYTDTEDHFNLAEREHI